MAYLPRLRSVGPSNDFISETLELKIVQMGFTLRAAAKSMKVPIDDIEVDPKHEKMFMLLMLECGDPAAKAWDTPQWENFGAILHQFGILPRPDAHGMKPSKNILEQYAVWYGREQSRINEKTHT